MSDKGYRLIKLTNGDNIITKIKTISNNTIIVENPFVYKTMSMFTPFGTKNMVLFKKWFELSSESTFEIATNTIMSISVPNEKTLDLYEKEKERKQTPYISNDELYQNPNLMKLIEDNGSPNSTPKQVPIDEKEKSDEVYGIVNINLKITPEFLEENEGLENLLRAMGIPVDQILAQQEQDEEELEEEEEEIINETNKKLEFGNDLDDWSPDPNDYLK